MIERNIDMAALELAWQDESPDNSYYLDLDTGNVELVQHGLFDLRDLTDQIEKDRDRYLYIPKPKPDQIKKDMKDFIDEVTEPQMARLLPVAMESPNAVFACRSVLAKNPEELARWEEFRKSRTLIRIRQWMAANFIDSEPEQEDFSVPND